MAIADRSTGAIAPLENESSSSGRSRAHRYVRIAGHEFPTFPIITPIKLSLMKAGSLA